MVGVVAAAAVVDVMEETVEVEAVTDQDLGNILTDVISIYIIAVTLKDLADILLMKFE